MIDRPVHSLIGVLALLGVAVPFAAMAAPQAPPPIRSTMPRATAAKPTAFNGAEPGDDKIKIKLSEDGKVIFVAGEFVAGSYRKFARILKSAPAVRTVHLGSPGGIVLEGFLMSALVRERKLNTYVETACSSSCTQVLPLSMKTKRKRRTLPPSRQRIAIQLRKRVGRKSQRRTLHRSRANQWSPMKMTIWFSN
jgi:hypothetical protein